MQNDFGAESRRLTPVGCGRDLRTNTGTATPIVVAAELVCVTMEERGYGDMISFVELRTAIAQAEEKERRDLSTTPDVS